MPEYPGGVYFVSSAENCSTFDKLMNYNGRNGNFLTWDHVSRWGAELRFIVLYKRYDRWVKYWRIRRDSRALPEWTQELYGMLYRTIISEKYFWSKAWNMDILLSWIQIYNVIIPKNCEMLIISNKVVINVRKIRKYFEFELRELKRHYKYEEEKVHDCFLLLCI